jgi:hypothetical protein
MTVLCGSAAAWPILVHAQQRVMPDMWRVAMSASNLVSPIVDERKFSHHQPAVMGITKWSI